ncbi:MAG: hypothetical protein ACI4HQ_11235 [Acetatifactor sp.]
MEQDARLEKALDTLHGYILALAAQAGKDASYGENLWESIKSSPGLLRELAYYHDYGKFLCEYRVAGYTLADVLVWQVDHFKLYMDRGEEMNRYRSERLLLSAFETMAEMEKNPAPIIRKLEDESGQDAVNG